MTFPSQKKMKNFIGNDCLEIENYYKLLQYYF